MKNLLVVIMILGFLVVGALEVKILKNQSLYMSQEKPLESEKFEEEKQLEEVSMVDGFENLIDSLGESENYLATINCELLNVREGQSTDYSVLGVMTPEDVALVIGRQDGWYQIYVEGEKYTGYGWVYGNKIDVILYDETTGEMTAMNEK